MEGKLVLPMTHKKGKNNAEFSTCDNTPKHPCFNEVKDLNTRAMLVLIAGCDTLASGLRNGVDSKLCYQIACAISGNDINEKIKPCVDLIVKETKPKLVTVEDWKMSIACLVNSLAYEPTHNGHINDAIPDELEKHDEECKFSGETKTIDGPIV